jgi:hypothetical protein
VRKQLGGEHRRRSTLAEQLGVADEIPGAPRGEGSSSRAARGQDDSKTGFNCRVDRGPERQPCEQ